MTRKLCFRALALLFITAPALALMALPAYAQQSDAPPGNNGTIKIDDVAMDEGNENNPHPGCQFVVDFFGYDVGTRTVRLELEGQAPTGGGMLLVDEFTFDVASRESGNQLNFSRPVDLSDELAGIEPHPKQGWHVKLTAHVDGSQGSDRKHKVFWIEECAAAMPAAPEEVTPVVETPASDAEVDDLDVDVADTLAADVAAWNAAVWANAMEANAAGGGEPEVAVLSAGATQESGAGAGAAAAPAGTLPRTGPGTSWLLAIAAGICLAAGSGMVLAGRRA